MELLLEELHTISNSHFQHALDVNLKCKILTEMAGKATHGLDSDKGILVLHAQIARLGLRDLSPQMVVQQVKHLNVFHLLSQWMVELTNQRFVGVLLVMAPSMSVKMKAELLSNKLCHFHHAASALLA